MPFATRTPESRRLARRSTSRRPSAWVVTVAAVDRGQPRASPNGAIIAAPRTGPP